MSKLTRRPPRDVLESLRQEVGFCCPVAGCGTPYLTWHHFDPPWRVENHHRPEGMIALCRMHADQADNEAFTDDQLRELKRSGRDRATIVRGRFNWMRRDLLAVVGGNFYYEELVILQINNVNCIWFNRDEMGSLLLNFKMPSIAGRPRASIEDNVWTTLPDVAEVVCPPSGRIVEINYGNGDHFKAKFLTISSPSKLISQYPNRGIESWITEIKFPLTVVELTETAAGTIIDLRPTHTQLGGIAITDVFSSRSHVAAIHIEIAEEEFAKLFPIEEVT